MWTETKDGRDFIYEISKDVVSQVAPEEMDLFDELLQQYFENLQPPPQSPPIDDPLGSGLAEIMVAATPAAAAMASAVLGFIVGEVIKVTKEESASLIRKKIHDLFDPKESSEGSPPLTKEQLELVKKLARKQASRFGFTADKAEMMANALIGALTLAK